MAEKKITKRERFNEIINVLTKNEGTEDLVAFINKEIETLDKRNEKEKERRAEKKAEGDALGAAIVAQIEATPKTADEILAAIIEEFPDATRAKVTNRASKAVKENVIFKTYVKDDNKRKLVAYTTVDISEENE